MLNSINRIAVINDSIKYNNTFDKNMKKDNLTEMKSDETELSIEQEKLNLTKQDSNQVESKDKNTKQDNENPTVTYDKLADTLKDMAQIDGVYFEFVKDEETDEMLMRVVDKETKKVLKQYPSEITLKIAQIINNTLDTVGQITNATI